MEVKVLSYTDLKISDIAIGKCWDKQSQDGIVNTERIERVANKNKHASTIEHIVYSFDVSGVSRALLQELARHRIASLSVKSSRYTLKELLKTETMDQLRDFLVKTGNDFVDDLSVGALYNVRKALRKGISNDIVKFCMPESYKTEFVWTINARSLQNFLMLRTNKSAMWEIRKLAYEVYNNIPHEHKFLFSDSIYREE